jgi:GNAT superfamily N-acetyltransferase
LTKKVDVTSRENLEANKVSADPAKRGHRLNQILYDQTMDIVEFSLQDLFNIKNIVSDLHPRWFDAKAVKNIPIDAQLGKTFVAKDDGKVIGFIVIASLEGVTWINWMAVDLAHQGQLVGTKLLEHAEHYLLGLGIIQFHVDTVVEQSPADGSYDKTIQFYIKHGFILKKRGQEQKQQNFSFRRGVLVKNLA